jgi:hypothetical protein
LNKTDPFADHHGNRSNLRGIQALKDRIAINCDWIDLRVSPCPALDVHVFLERASMLSHLATVMLKSPSRHVLNLIWRLQRYMQ